MNYNCYNNNPDAKNYSNCDISGSFYSVGLTAAPGPSGLAAAAVKAAAAAAGPTGPAAAAAAEKCECIGTCSKKSS